MVGWWMDWVGCVGPCQTAAPREVNRQVHLIHQPISSTHQFIHRPTTQQSHHAHTPPRTQPLPTPARGGGVVPQPHGKYQPQHGDNEKDQAELNPRRAPLQSQVTPHHSHAPPGQVRGRGGGDGGGGPDQRGAFVSEYAQRLARGVVELPDVVAGWGREGPVEICGGRVCMAS